MISTTGTSRTQGGVNTYPLTIPEEPFGSGMYTLWARTPSTRLVDYTQAQVKRLGVLLVF